MDKAPGKPLFWLLEEATPEVAQLMFQLERSLGAAGTVQRVSYTDALRQLPREQTRRDLAGILCFSLTTLASLAKLLRGYASVCPRLCFFPTTYESLAGLRPGQRWPVPVSAVARHAGEAAMYELSGIAPEAVVRLLADVDPGHLPDTMRAIGRPLRIGFAWCNLGPAQREALETEVARWRQRSPERFDWRVACLPGQRPPEDAFDGVTRCEWGEEPVDEEQFDVVLADPWWPDVRPRPWRAPVHIHLPPGGTGTDAWHERLQALIDLGDQAGWEDDMLLAFAHQPLWRHLLKGEERPAPALGAPELTGLVAERAYWGAWLEQTRAEWDDRPPTPRALSFYFRSYDYFVNLCWCLDLWNALAGARNGERHAIVAAFNALPLHHTTSAWLLKRLLRASGVGGSAATTGPRRLGRRFWLHFGLTCSPIIVRWVRTLWRCGRDPAVDPLGDTREVGHQVLQAAGVTVVARNQPRPEAGIPTLYLLAHRHGDLDPFLLLEALPQYLAVVVGQRVLRWPMVARLGHSPAFVLTGRERGVVIADAIAALRSQRALALYAEVAEPSYLGESAPLRAGLAWIVQALERSQVIPVAIDDAFTWQPGGAVLGVHFGEPIPVTPTTSDNLADRVRQFYLQHLERTRRLDARAGFPLMLESIVPAVSGKHPTDVV